MSLRQRDQGHHYPFATSDGDRVHASAAERARPAGGFAPGLTLPGCLLGGDVRVASRQTSVAMLVVVGLLSEEGGRASEGVVAGSQAVAWSSCAKHHVEDPVGVGGVACAEPGHVRLYHGPVFVAAVGVAGQADIDDDGAGEAGGAGAEQAGGEVEHRGAMRAGVEGAGSSRPLVA